jgi:thiamine biosynthesis lipoprotein
MSNSVFQLHREGIEAPLHRFAHVAMNCEWEIYIAGEDAEYARQAAFAAFAEVETIEADISRFWQGSDVARLNAAQPGEEIRIGPHTRDCLMLAGEISEQTQGAFDIMVGRAMDKLRAGQTPGSESLADEPLLEIDPLRGVVTILAEGVAMDFGALGKGYAIDRILAVLREWSIENALAHSGGSTSAAMGAPPGLEAWPLALRDPRGEDLAEIIATVPLRDAALSGSSFQVQGSHIVDPRSGAPVKGKIGTWALCASAARSDGISTALMVMQPHEIEYFFDHHPDDSGLVLLGDPAQPQLLGSGPLAALELDLGELAISPVTPAHATPQTKQSAPEIAAETDPILRPFLGRGVVWFSRENERHSGTLIAASAHWIHFEADDGATVLVPREAIARVEVAM